MTMLFSNVSENRLIFSRKCHLQRKHVYSGSKEIFEKEKMTSIALHLKLQILVILFSCIFRLPSYKPMITFRLVAMKVGSNTTISHFVTVIKSSSRSNYYSSGRRMILVLILPLITRRFHVIPFQCLVLTLS